MAPDKALTRRWTLLRHVGDQDSTFGLDLLVRYLDQDAVPSWSNLQEMHQQRINAMLEQYYKAKKRLENNHKEELDSLNQKITKLRDLIQKATEEELEIKQKGQEEKPFILNSQHSQKLIKSKLKLSLENCGIFNLCSPNEKLDFSSQSTEIVLLC